MFAISRQIVLPTIIAWAISNVMTLGVWDFSPGAVIALAGIISGRLALATETGVFGLLVFAVLCSIAMVLATFAIHNFMKIPSIITSLGILMIYETLTAVLFESQGVAIRGKITILGKSPYIFIVFLVLAIIIYFLNEKTVFGYNVRALGNGTDIANNIGLSLTKTRLKGFIFEGFFLGVATVISLSISGSSKATVNMASMTMAFDAIMGVFIGLYLVRYCNIVVGIVIGVFTMRMMGAGLLSMGLRSSLQQVATGTFLLLFMGISQNQNKLFEIREFRRKAIEAELRQMKS
jgi:ribose transport system permease protein